MIFCGDIALPFVRAVKLNSFPDSILNQKWIGNLEGSLLKCNGNKKKESLLKAHLVFNDYDAIKDLCERIPFVAFNIANNHILDAASVQTTINYLEALNISFVGAGRDKLEAKKPLVISECSSEYIIVSFGWEAVNCIVATKRSEGVNPYSPSYVLCQIDELKCKYPDKKIICLFHWNYELEKFPQPMDREIAKRLIDKGVFAVIGCHAHRIQPIEFYKGRPIVYGMGNFCFPQSVYVNGKLKFPDFTLDEYAIELNNEKIIVHKFKYDRHNNTLTYNGMIDCGDIEKNEFNNLTSQEYVRWFRHNRYQKKMLPIFVYPCSKLSNICKLKFVVIRNKITKLLFKNKRIFNTVKTLVSKIYG